jgi:hypothetical protein
MLKTYSISGSVRVAGTSEHAKVVVGGGCAVQGEVGGGVAHRLRWEAVERWVAVCRASAQ